jgi:hypothetical protein
MPATKCEASGPCDGVRLGNAQRTLMGQGDGRFELDNDSSIAFLTPGTAVTLTGRSSVTGAPASVVRIVIDGLYDK